MCIEHSYLVSQSNIAQESVRYIKIRIKNQSQEDQMRKEKKIWRSKKSYSKNRSQNKVNLSNNEQYQSQFEFYVQYQTYYQLYKPIIQNIIFKFFPYIDYMNQIFHESAQNLRQQKFELAFQQIEKVQTQNPYSIHTLLNKSTISISKGDVNEGLGYLKKAIQSDPFDFRLYYNMFAICCRNKQYLLGSKNLKKCISCLLTLKISQGVSCNEIEEINRAIELWPQNTASYALKAIKLINDNKIEQANQVTKQALQKCIMKHHIFAISCLIDTKLNNQAQREQNARDYHAHLLRPLVIQEHSIEQGSIDNSKAIILSLILEFNKICESCQTGQYKQYNNTKGIYFMSVRGKTSINIEYEISKNLGIIDLACIEQQNLNEGQDEKMNNLSKQGQEQQINLQKNKEQQIQTKSAKSKGPVKVYNWEQIQLDQEDIKSGNTNHLLNGEEYQSKIQIPSELEIKQKIKEPKTLNLIQTNTKEHKLQKVEQKIVNTNVVPPKINNSNQQERQQSKHLKQERGKHSQESQYLYPVTHPNFQIKLILADLQINQQLFGKMDPYVYYEYANQKHKSTIAKGQGTKPRWQNEIKIFSLEKIPTNMKISVYDREVFKWDDLVGVGNLEVNKTGIHIIPIFIKQKKAGEVMFFISKVK